VATINFLHRFTHILIAILLCVLLQACSTTWTQLGGHDLIDDRNYQSTCDPEKGISAIYSGTQLNAYCLWNNVDNVALFCLIDLPMSLALDTVMLPYTLFSELTDIGYCNISNLEPSTLTPLRP